MALGAVVGALRVNLGLNSAEFDKKLKRANRQAEAFASGVGTALGAAIATVATGMAVLAGSIINGSSELQKMIDISNSSAIEFQRFAAAASTVGIENEKLADIFKDVNDRVGDFVQTGGGPMADFFEKIGPKVGVTAESFKNLSGPQALGLFVDSLQKAGVSQQDMTFYMEAMAGDATALIPLLKDNGAELNRLADAADRFGTFLTQEDLDLLTEAKTSIGDVWKGITGIATDIAVAIAPAVKSVADFFAEMLEKDGPIRGMLEALINNFRQVGITVGIAMAISAAAVFGLNGALTVLMFSLAALKIALLATGIGAIAVLLGYVAEYFFDLVDRLGSFGAAFNDVLFDIQQALANWSGYISFALISLAVYFRIALASAAGAAAGAMYAFVRSLVVAGAAMVMNQIRGIALGAAMSYLLAVQGGASVKTAILTTAIKTLSTAMRAVPIVAIIAGISWLIQKFLQTAQGLGGLSEAFWAWADVVSAAVDVAVGYFWYLGERIGIGMERANANLQINVALMKIAFAGFINNSVNLLEGFIGSASAILGALPGIMKKVAIEAANSLVDAIESAIGGVASAINSLLTGVGLDPIAPPDLSGWKMAVPEAKGIGEAVSGAFNDAFSDNIIDTNAENAVVSKAESVLAGLPDKATAAFEANVGPAQARLAAGWNRITKAISDSEGTLSLGDIIFPPTLTYETKETTKETDELADALNGLGTAGTGAGKALEDGVGGGAAKAGKELDDLNEKLEERTKANLERMRDMFADTFTDIVTGTKSVRDAIADLLMDMAKAIASSAFKQFFGTLFGGGGGGGGGFWGSVANFLFGGIGANANGTNNWRGGLTEVNERGSELMNLPSGTQIIPADLSRRMANAGGGGASTIQIDLGPDLEARILKQAETQSLRITEGGLKSYDANVMPRRVAQISNDPRRIG